MSAGHLAHEQLTRLHASTTSLLSAAQCLLTGADTNPPDRLFADWRTLDERLTAWGVAAGDYTSPQRGEVRASASLADHVAAGLPVLLGCPSAHETARDLARDNFLLAGQVLLGAARDLCQFGRLMGWHGVRVEDFAAAASGFRGDEFRHQADTLSRRLRIVRTLVVQEYARAVASAGRMGAGGADVHTPAAAAACAHGPQGPFAKGCFRFGGVTASGFGEKTWRLLAALWDSSADAPTEPRPAADVWRAVYGRRRFDRKRLRDLVGRLNDDWLSLCGPSGPVVEFTARGSPLLVLRLR